MNWVDITIFVICFILFIVGYKRGLINQIFSIAALVGGVLCGFILFDIVGARLVQHNIIEGRSAADIIGFITVAVLAYIIIQIVGSLITRLLGKLKLGWLDRLGGGAIGLIIGVIVSFFLISSMNLVLEDDKSLKKSIFANKVIDSYKYMKSIIPVDLQKQYENTKKLVKDKSKEAVLNKLDSRENKSQKKKTEEKKTEEKKKTDSPEK